MKEFIDGLSDEDAAEVVAAMAEVREEGLDAGRHLRGDIYEVRAEGRDLALRILFAQEGKKGGILLALEGFAKKSRTTPDRLIRLAERRLADCRAKAQAGPRRRGEHIAALLPT